MTLISYFRNELSTCGSNSSQTCEERECCLRHYVGSCGENVRTSVREKVCTDASAAKGAFNSNINGVSHLMHHQHYHHQHPHL